MAHSQRLALAGGPGKRERLRDLRKQMLERGSYALAAADPEFMRECEEIDRAFDVTVADGLEGDDAW